jgi:hypothetical protein
LTLSPNALFVRRFSAHISTPAWHLTRKEFQQMRRKGYPTMEAMRCELYLSGSQCWRLPEAQA